MTLFGQFDNLLLELNREDPASYKNFLRVEELFGEILHRNSPNSTKNCYLSFTDSCEWFTIVTIYLRVIYGNINPWTLVRRFLTCQKFACIFTDPCEYLRVVPSYLRISVSYLRMLACDYELAIRNDSKEKSVQLCRSVIVNSL